MLDRTVDEDQTSAVNSHVVELGCRISELERALASSRAIGTAIGLVMCMHQVDREKAFAYLIRLSQNNNIKLRMVADVLIQDAERAGGNPAVPNTAVTSADPIMLS